MCSWSCLVLPGASGQVRSSGWIQIRVSLGRYGLWYGHGLACSGMDGMGGMEKEWKQALSPTWQQTEGFHDGGGGGEEKKSGTPGTVL